jgi:hypothetical protein
MGFGQGSLGPKDSLAHGLLRHEEGAGNLSGGEAANQAQRKSDTPFNRKHRMAGGKDEAEDVVVDDLIQGLIHCFTEPLLSKFKLARNLSMLLLKHLTAP